jgi:hypothetical protein
MCPAYCFQHYDLYDKAEPVGQALPRPLPFFKKHLGVTQATLTLQKPRGCVSGRGKPDFSIINSSAKGKEHGQDQLCQFQQQDHHDVGRHQLP